MFKLINNGLEIKSRQFHSFVQKPQNRIIYVDGEKYNMPLPYLLFINNTDEQFVLAFKHFMFENNEIKYNKNNPPHLLPLPNVNQEGAICLGKKIKSLDKFITRFYKSNFESTEVEPNYPKELQNYEPFKKENVEYYIEGKYLRLLSRYYSKETTKHLMNLSIERNSILYKELILSRTYTNYFTSLNV